jgi:4'-phosphopantetheinyl transferase
MGPMHVYWFEQNMASVPQGDAWLSVHELKHLLSLRFPKRRADWLLGRWTAKNAVAFCLNLSAGPESLRDIEIRPASSGAPEVFISDEPADVTISISHREGVAACALARQGVLLGCDLEIIEPHGDAFAADYFSAHEQALLSAAPKEAHNPLVALLWSAKESALKALREGLRLDARGVIVTPGVAPLTATEDWHPLQARFVNGQNFHGWWNQSRGFIRTILAAPPPGPPVLLAKERSLVLCPETISSVPASNLPSAN